MAGAARVEKRSLEEAAGSVEGTHLQPARPSKRRRLSDASVLCMREMFRAMVRDGNVTQEDRLILQNAAVLLSQVKGNTWVTFPDSDGNLRDLNLSRQHMQQLRSFLEKVAEQIKEEHTTLPSEGSDESDELQLAAVPWAQGITANELLNCCGPEVDLEYKGKLRWLERVTKPLPSKFMLKARARELINHYYIKHYMSEPQTAGAASSGQDQAAADLVTSAPGRCLRRCGRAALCCATYLQTTAVKCAQAVISLISSAVIELASLLAFVLCKLSFNVSTKTPLWPFLRFFLAAMIHGRAICFFEFIMLMARWRVILCLASYNTFCGTLFFPFVYIANKFLKWNEGLTQKIMGCACDDSPSILAFIPVNVANCFVWILNSAVCLACPGFAVAHAKAMIDWLHPMLSMLFDIIFSIGVAEGLAKLLSLADGTVQPKLVLLSMDVARRLREDTLSSATSCAEANQGNGVPAASDEAQRLPVRQDAASPLPEWRDDGAWNVFESS